MKDTFTFYESGYRKPEKEEVAVKETDPVEKLFEFLDTLSKMKKNVLVVIPKYVSKRKLSQEVGRMGALYQYSTNTICKENFRALLFHNGLEDTVKLRGHIFDCVIYFYCSPTPILRNTSRLCMRGVPFEIYMG